MFWSYLNDPECTNTLLGIVFVSCILVHEALTFSCIATVGTLAIERFGWLFGVGAPTFP
jgi:hypothetical protein